MGSRESSSSKKWGLRVDLEVAVWTFVRYFCSGHEFWATSDRAASESKLVGTWPVLAGCRHGSRDGEVRGNCLGTEPRSPLPTAVLYFLLQVSFLVDEGVSPVLLQLLSCALCGSKVLAALAASAGSSTASSSSAPVAASSGQATTQSKSSTKKSKKEEKEKEKEGKRL